jgi:hypothetical protein
LPRRTADESRELAALHSGAGEDRGRHREVERLGSFQVDALPPGRARL